MRIAREIVETLKMELGFLKYKDTELSISTKAKELKIIFSANFDGFKTDLPSVCEFAVEFDPTFRGLNSNPEDININDIENDLNFEIFESSIREGNFSVNSADFSVRDETSQYNVKGVNLDNFQSRFESLEVLKPLSDKSFVQQRLIEKEKITYHGFNLKKPAFEVRFKSADKGLIPPNLFSTDFLPEEYVEKSKILSAVKSLSEKYNISLLKFYGYYKNIPVEDVLSMKILSNKNLRVIFNSSKTTRFKHKTPLCKDFIVFKYEDRFVYHII